jgi:hypothetical protein
MDNLPDGCTLADIDEAAAGRYSDMAGEPDYDPCLGHMHDPEGRKRCNTPGTPDVLIGGYIILRPGQDICEACGFPYDKAEVYGEAMCFKCSYGGSH